MARDIRQECLEVLRDRIRREEATLAHLRRTQPIDSDHTNSIRLLVKYLYEVVHEIETKVSPDERAEPRDRETAE